ncbi:MAG TPA: hypothetical protein VGP92_01590 [Acidimicrobiia bacterium]|nr:hypothetical protein [Acidimicrobiia bacterium]
MSLTRPDHPLRVAAVGTFLLVGVTALILGGAAQVNGPATVQRPAEIISLQPNESDQLLPQGGVGAQLRSEFTGQITIDGRVIPQDQISGDPNLGEVLFDPGPGKDIREFTKGGHSAVIQWWPRTIPTAEAARAKHQLRSYTWSFNVG